MCNEKENYGGKIIFGLYEQFLKFTTNYTYGRHLSKNVLISYSASFRPGRLTGILNFTSYTA